MQNNTYFWPFHVFSFWQMVVSFQCVIPDRESLDCRKLHSPVDLNLEMGAMLFTPRPCHYLAYLALLMSHNYQYTFIKVDWLSKYIHILSCVLHRGFDLYQIMVHLDDNSDVREPSDISEN